MTEAKTKETAVNTEEVVTRQILTEELEMQECKILEEIRQMDRNLSALIEDQNHKIQALAEGIIMQVESSDRKWKEHLAAHGLLDRRMNRLEAEVLIP